MFEFRFYEIWREPVYIEKLFNGIWISIELSTLSGILGLILGLILATAQHPTSPRIFRYASIYYVEMVRNTPFIVQLFLSSSVSHSCSTIAGRLKLPPCWR